MPPHFLSSVVFAISCIHSTASESAIRDATKQIFAASNEPLVDFIGAVTASQLPELPSPGDEDSFPAMEQVRDLLLERVFDGDKSSFHAYSEMIDSEKASIIENLIALANLRKWLMRHHSYSNLALGAIIEERVSITVTLFLCEGALTPGEARLIIQSLQPRLTATAIVNAARRYAPHSTALAEFDVQTAIRDGWSTPITLSNLMTKDTPHDDRVYTTSDLFPHTNIPALVAVVMQTAMLSFIAHEVIVFAERGGDLHANESAFKKTFERLSPESSGKRDPASLLTITEDTPYPFIQLIRELHSN